MRVWKPVLVAAGIIPARKPGQRFQARTRRAVDSVFREGGDTDDGPGGRKGILTCG